MNFPKSTQDLQNSKPEVWEGETDKGTHWSVGPARQRHSDRGDARRWRGLRWIQGHLRVPLLKATLLTYFSRALLDPRVLAVANGGAAVLRGVTPADLGNGDAVSLADEQERLKTKL